MIKYCAGFLFDPTSNYVMLLTKQRPSWQAGLLNAIGGKLEPGETSLQAMCREWHEEVGRSIKIDNWKNYVTLKGREFEVDFFYSNNKSIYQINQEAHNLDEQVDIYKINELFNGDYPMIPNLRWLIPMATSMIYSVNISHYVVQEYEEKCSIE